MESRVAVRWKHWSGSYISDAAYVYDTRVLSTDFPPMCMRKTRMPMLGSLPTTQARLNRSANPQGFRHSVPPRC